MTEANREDLKALQINGNVVTLPTAQLNDYNTLKKTLTKACGKYKRNTFEFPYEAQAVIDTLLSGKVIDFKKEFQFFATPVDVAEEMTSQIIGYPANMLEPSAGHGALIDAVLNIRPDIEVTAIELSELNLNILNNKYSQVSIIEGDFLEFNQDDKFDLIIANPPFSKNQDIDHFMKMWELLADGGQLITIMSKSWTFGSQKKQVKFREFLEEIEAEIRTNENGAFKSSGTMVQSVMVTAYK